MNISGLLQSLRRTIEIVWALLETVCCLCRCMGGNARKGSGAKPGAEVEEKRDEGGRESGKEPEEPEV